MSEQMAEVIQLRRWRPSLHLGTRLREVRIQWGDHKGVNFTQEAFAGLIGVPVGSYKGWENTGRCADAVELANKLGAVIPSFDRGWFLGIADDDPSFPEPPDQGIASTRWGMHRHLALAA